MQSKRRLNFCMITSTEALLQLPDAQRRAGSVPGKSGTGLQGCKPGKGGSTTSYQANQKTTVETLVLFCYLPQGGLLYAGEETPAGNDLTLTSLPARNADLSMRRLEHHFDHKQQFCSFCRQTGAA